jgi:hypothetical protein
MYEWKCALGYPNVEVFPKQDELASDTDTGNWINLPYYNQESTSRMALLDMKELDLGEFLKLADSRAITPDTLKEFKIPRAKVMMGSPPCLDVIYNTGEGKFRNNAMYNYGVFCSRKFGDDWEVEFEKINQHAMKPPLDSEELTNIKKSVRRKKDEYFYKCKDTPICNVCDREQCLKRKYGIGGAKELNIALSNLRRLDTTPPIWMLDVNGKGMTLTDTQQLIFPQKFAARCVDEINILPNTVKHEEWRELVSALLANVEVIEAPEDAGVDGSFIDLFKQWIRESPKARNKDEILLGQPYTSKNRVYFRAAEMKKYITREVKMEGPRMWYLLKRYLDAEVSTLRLKGIPSRIWSVREFESQDEDFDIPESPDM